MIYNNQYIDTVKIEAYHNNCIKIIIKNGEQEISLYFNKNYNFKNMKIKEKIDLINYIYWDTTLKTKETYYLFDITKDKVYLTKIEENKFIIEIDIESPDMIFCPLGENETFNNLKVNAEFSFIE